MQDVSGYTGTGSGTNVAGLFLTLKPFEKRKLSVRKVIDRLRPKLMALPGAPTVLQAVQELRIGGRQSRALYQYTLMSTDLAQLMAWAPRMTAKVRTLASVCGRQQRSAEQGVQAYLVIDRPTASRLGITPALIDNTLYDAYGQSQVSITYTQLNQYHVVMEVAPPFWQRPETLRDLYVRPPNGPMVPLSAFTHYEQTPTSLSVNHQGQFPAVTISFNLGLGYALGDAVIAIEKAKREMGMPDAIRGQFMGTAQAYEAALASEPLLILFALLAVYIVLGILYESYVHPITILSTLPSAGVGAMLALLAARTELTVVAVIGILLLIGIVKKNGIMMVDFALETERREGKRPEEAIYEACLLRFRPIMMTTMAAALGALPLAVGTGVASELRRPLGITIVGGLIFSQALTLYTTPVMYLYLDRFRLWMKGKRGEGRSGVTNEIATGPEGL